MKKILGVTMGRSLRVFWRLHETLSQTTTLAPPALFVADSMEFDKLASGLAGIEKASLLKEWELMRQAENADFDLDRLAAWQETLHTSLWNALLADRRIFFGRLCKVKQDYAPHFSEEQLGAIALIFLDRIDAFLEAEAPDLVLSFGTTTLGDYLFELLARRRGIPYAQLKATKVSNRVAFIDTGLDVPKRWAQKLNSDWEPTAEQLQEARDYLQSVRSHGVRYEGAILFSRSRMMSRLVKAPVALARSAYTELRRRRNPVYRNDNHISPPLPGAWYTNVVHPVRTYLLGKRFKFLGLQDVKALGRFIFFPLHFEPEVAVQVFGKPYQNQIETVRQLALSVPLGVRILVKEHPRSLGFRPPGYYRRLLDIPNVRLADPFLSASSIVKHAELVTVISGSIGLEGAVNQKPVAVLGKTPYQLLPDSMVRAIDSGLGMSEALDRLRNEHVHDEAALERYIAMIISESVPANLYSGLLGKEGRYVEKQEEMKKSYALLADAISRL
ncbi:hypothetical protein DPQ33_18120 [Oceanidesulfovibrio indonesiensis]|uniref:Capsule biosynthesis protein n=1 Tax=Oceanidesulfovibrio indonesiensis TaxID=54767 RepID=A0A7M3M9W4_9BACT|nr:hypothetical protein [Oceanidesulfovibrio indonesiensis]TVM13820.1 hypothetical protein DPQ33_18120 [Oceanidesulfovibrio indonesiensis]